MNNFIQKLNRLEGQVRGIRKMYQEDRDCLEIAQQIVAARQALAGLGKDLLTDEATKCSRLRGKQDEFKKVLETLFKVT